MKPKPNRVPTFILFRKLIVILTAVYIGATFFLKAFAVRACSPNYTLSNSADSAGHVDAQEAKSQSWYEAFASRITTTFYWANHHRREAEIESRLYNAHFVYVIYNLNKKTTKLTHSSA